MTTTPAVIYISNDNVAKLSGLIDSDGAYANSATVVVTLIDSSGNEVAGESWPLTMNYVASSDGVYIATLADTLTLTADTEYTAIISADAGAGKQGYWEVPAVAETRVR